MKAGIIFSGSEPILILTSYESFLEPDVVGKLKAKDFNKFIAYELPVEEVRKKYGNHYDVVMEDLKQDDTLRVVDEDGHHILDNFSLKSLGDPIYWESGV